MRTLALTLTVLTILPAGLFAADWPGYGGPDRTNVVTGADLPKKFPAGGPKVLWKIDVGDGFGGAAIKDNEVYILDRIGGRGDVVRCLDLADGKEKWSHSYAAPGRVSFDGSRSVPSVDDKSVFTVGCFGHVHCLDRKTGKPVWSKNIMRDFGGRAPLPKWGWSQSPLLYKDWVILAPQNDRIGLVALDKATGKQVWASEPAGDAHYVSPVLITVDGVEQLVIVNKTGATAFDAATGKKLWNYGDWTCRISIPNVTHVGEGRVLITGGYNAGSDMIQVARKGGKWTATKRWRNGEINSQMNPAIVHEGYLYINANHNDNLRAGLMCVDPASGKVLWTTRDNPDFQRGHMMLVDDILYIIAGEAGTLHMVELSPEKYKEVDVAKGLLDGKRIWAPLALSGTKLIIRDQKKMLCVDLAQGN